MFEVKFDGQDAVAITVFAADEAEALAKAFQWAVANSKNIFGAGIVKTGTYKTVAVVK